jgi:hypothetical protein
MLFKITHALIAIPNIILIPTEFVKINPVLIVITVLNVGGFDNHLF